MSVESFRVNASISVVDAAVVGSQTVRETFPLSLATSFTVGAGAGSLNKQWNAQRTLPGADETLDLTGGIANGRGEAITLAKVKSFFAHNPAGNGPITLGGGTNAIASIFGTTLVLPPGTTLLLWTTDVNGWAVTVSTGDQLKVAGTMGDEYILAIGGE